jgi:hypothetical protein
LVVESKKVYLFAGDTNARSSSSPTTTTGEEELGNYFILIFSSSSDCALTDVVKRRG